MERIGEAISKLERRAMEAERDTIDRYVAAYLAERVGELCEVRITGVTNFGFFATVDGIGGDGLMPVRDLGGEYFRYDETAKKLVGEQSGDEYHHRPAADAAAGRIQSGVGRAALRTARGERRGARQRGRRASCNGAAVRPTSGIRASGGNEGIRRWVEQRQEQRRARWRGHGGG